MNARQQTIIREIEAIVSLLEHLDKVKRQSVFWQHSQNKAEELIEELHSQLVIEVRDFNNNGLAVETDDIPF